MLWLRNVADHCTVTGPNPQTIDIPLVQTATAAFAVTCAGRSTVRITVESSGSPPDPDGYAARFEGASSTISALVPAEGIADVAVAPGRHIVSLLGVAANCVVLADGSGLTREVDVAAYASATVSFSVTCAPIAVPPIAFVRDGRIYAVNPDGTGLLRLSDGPNDSEPAWSLDGQRIAFVRRTGPRDSYGRELQDVYVMDAFGSHVVQLSKSGYARQPTWSPNGRKIAFADFCEGQGCIQVVDVDADETKPLRIGFDRGVHDSPAWSPDGEKIAFTSDYRAFDFVYDLYVMDANRGSPIALLEGPFLAGAFTFYFQPAWSPDARRIAIVVCGWDWDNCYPNSRIAVLNADGSNIREIAATGGLARPTWSPNGDELAYSRTTCRNCPSSLYIVGADGRNQRLLLADGHSPSWRP